MNWDDLRFVLEVARAGSLVAAAKNLRVAHTTVSRRIQALEQTHSVNLFERRGSIYHPTLVAMGLVQLAGEMDERIDALERQLEAQAHTPSVEGEVRIATVAALADRLGPELVAFRERYPDVRLWICVSNDMVSLAKGEADVAIRITRKPPERLVGRKLADVHFAVFGAPPAIPEARRDRVVPDDIFSLPWVCLDTSRCHTPQGRWESQHVPPDRVVLRTSSRGLFLDAVMRGMGVGVLPIGLAHEPTPGFTPHGQASPVTQLVQVSDRLNEITLPVWILTHADLRNTPRIRAVMDFFAEAIGEAKDRF